MIIKREKKKKGKDSMRWYIEFLCDCCGNVYDRAERDHNRISKHELYDKDYCEKCWRCVLAKRPSYRKNISNMLLKRYKDRPELKQQISQTLINSGANIGDKNGMKQIEARTKVSVARKKMFEDPELRKIYSERTRKAWEDGKFEGVRVGQCKWYDYTHSDGTIYKVQGTWELAFVKWLDDTNLKFKCHRERIPYILEDNKKNWYPDFFVFEWDSYIDVKCEHFYIKEKFDAIQKCNPDIKVKLLFKKELKELGVEI